MAFKGQTGPDQIGLPSGNAIPITSACLSQEAFTRMQAEVEELQAEVEELWAALAKKSADYTRLEVLYAQLKVDMAGVQKKFSKIEQENEHLKDEKKVLQASNEKLQAENLRLRRMQFGQSSEQINNAGQENSNTTALPEGTTSSADDDTEESRMAEGRTDADSAAGITFSSGSSADDSTEGENTSPKEKKSSNAGPGSRPNGIRKQMAEKLPTVNHYPLSRELVRRLDQKYGKGQWNVRDWEPTAHLVHIPEMYVNQIDHVPVLRLKDGTLARPFTDFPDEFPTSVLPHSILTPSEFANIVHKKIGMGIPLYRQEKDMLQMNGVHVGRQDMAKWMIQAATQGFKQVYEYLIRQEQACEHHSIDETFLQVLHDGRAASTKSYLWAHRTGELANPKHPVVVFVFEKTRSTEHLRKYFPEDIAAIISCDHYIAYEVLEGERENIRISLCWMHVRRRFFFAFDLVAGIKDLSEEEICNSLEKKLLEKIAEIYREEMKLKNLSPEEREKQRKEKVRPLVEAFFAMLHELDPDNPMYSHTLQDAIKYTLSGEEKLKRFLDDPCLPIDNGSAERIIRSVATGRRAWLFCDTPEGAEALAVLYSLVVTAQLNQANDYYYIKYLCEHVPGKLLGPSRQLSDEELEALMPWSVEYKAYEEHEIQTRFDEITFRGNMKEPTKADIQDMRRQMEQEEAQKSVSVDSDSLMPCPQAAVLQAKCDVDELDTSPALLACMSDLSATANELVRMPNLEQSNNISGYDAVKAPPNSRSSPVICSFSEEAERKTG